MSHLQPDARILVTGGAGFIGSHLVDSLLADGYRVRVFDNLDPQVHGTLREQRRWPEYCNPDAEYHLGDVRVRDSLAFALRDMDAVIHLAAVTGVGQSMYQIAHYFEVNVQGTANLLNLLANKRHHVRRLVIASSRAVYGEGLYDCQHCGPVCPPLRSPSQLDRQDWEVYCPTCGSSLHPLPTPECKLPSPGSMYAITKLSQEQMSLAFGAAYGLPVTALRFFNVYGPRQSMNNPYTGILTVFLNRLLSGQAPEVYEDGQMSRDFVYVADVVQACRLGLEYPGLGVFNIGSGRATTVLEFAQMLSRQIAPALAPHMAGKARVGDIRHCTADLRQANQVLGYHTQTPLEAGLQAVIAEARAAERADQSLLAERELAQLGLLRG